MHSFSVQNVHTHGFPIILPFAGGNTKKPLGLQLRAGIDVLITYGGMYLTLRRDDEATAPK